MSEQIRTLTEAKNTILELTEKHKFANYTVSFIDKGHKRTVVASCNNFRRTFEFIKHYATHLTNEDFVGVILHEIAHALTPGHGHDGYFKSVCRRIGGVPDARTDFSYAEESAPVFLQKKINYIYKCPTCGYEMKTTKKLKRQYSCGKCVPRHFDKNFILVLTTERKTTERLQGFSISA